MTIPTNEEILSLLDRLDDGPADSLETHWLEFKPWEGPKDTRRVAVETAVCFANAEGGVIVFGVHDQKIGRANAIHGAKNYDFSAWRRDIYDSTRPNLGVDIEELSVAEGTGKLVLVRVPSGDGSTVYGTSDGVYKKRVGEHCMPLDPQSWMRARISSGAVDWSGAPAEGVEMSDLDPVEVARARNLLRRAAADSDILRLEESSFLSALGAVSKGQVTHAGLLLFGREDVLTRRCPQQQLHYVHLASETKVARNDTYHAGLLNLLERIEQAFTGPTNPEAELTVGLLKLRIPAYPIEVVREAVLNAITHRDYSDPGEVLIRHTARELIVTSPGGFVSGITPANILRHEPVARNRRLAEAFQKLRLVERAGVGRRRIFESLLSFGKRAPVYETDGARVTLRVFNGTFDAALVGMVAKWRSGGREFDLDTLLVLSFLREHPFIDSGSAAGLLQCSRDEASRILDGLAQSRSGILERRGRTRAVTYHLTKGIAKDLLGKAAYTKTRGLHPIRYAEMVRTFLESHDSITPQECRELLGLGESNSAKVEVSQHLKRWAEGEKAFIRAEGKGPSRRYYLRQS